MAELTGRAVLSADGAQSGLHRRLCAASAGAVRPDTSPWIAPTPLRPASAMRPPAWHSPTMEHSTPWQTEGQFTTQPSAGQGWSLPQNRQRYFPGVGGGQSRASSRLVRQPVHGQLRNLRYRSWRMATGPYRSMFRTHQASPRSPRLTAGSGGALYVAWMDNSPGYWTIYVGTVERYLLEQSADCQRAWPGPDFGLFPRWCALSRLAGSRADGRQPHRHLPYLLQRTPRWLLDAADRCFCIGRRWTPSART